MGFAVLLSENYRIAVGAAVLTAVAAQVSDRSAVHACARHGADRRRHSQSEYRLEAASVQAFKSRLRVLPTWGVRRLPDGTGG